MSELLMSEDALQVPSSSGRPLVFDMRKVHKAERRLFELASITKAKAGELQATMIDAYGEARRYYAILKAEFGRCKQKTRSVRGTIVLDKAPDILKANGLASARSPAGSEDLRDSVVNIDRDYIEATDTLLQVEAAMDHMESTAEKLKMAYYAIRDLVQGSDLSRRDVSGGVGDDEPGSLSQSEKVTQFVNQHSTVKQESYDDGFGAPKY